VHNVYRAPVPERATHYESFNGGPSHYRSAPTASERRFENVQHREPTQEQSEHERRSIGMPEQRMGNNHGVPPTAATPRPGGFNDPQVEHVRPAPAMRAEPVRVNPGAARPEGHPGGRQGEHPAERQGEHHGRPEGDRR